MASVYVLGQSIKLSATFTDAAGSPANPTSVTLTVVSPGGVVTAPTPANTGTGAYEAIISVSEAGLWRYRWAGATGTTTPADERWFTVSRSLVA